jgi:putative endonuclease
MGFEDYERQDDDAREDEAEVELDPDERDPDEEPGDDGEKDKGRKPLSEYSSKEIGDEGESLAASYLERRGYVLVDRNWSSSAGEVDIIAEDDDETVLLEVKTRLALGEDADTMPELAVDAKKQRRYRRLALLYLADHPHVSSVRFDVIAINLVAERTARLRHLIGAFSWDDNAS